MANAIMIQGTASNAGKSLLAAGLCRIFAQDGYKVAPFKSQNMALNSAITPDGFEMGRAQVVQSEAAGVAPDVRMNPILLKPTSHVGSQVIVNGVPRGTMAAGEYFRYRKSLIPEVMAAYESAVSKRLSSLEASAEINLKREDFVNMGMAKMAKAPVLLCGDIDRGGVFASLYGTVKLLEPDEQARIKGLIINKFRGDVDILRPGLGVVVRRRNQDGELELPPQGGGGHQLPPQGRGEKGRNFGRVHRLPLLGGEEGPLHQPGDLGPHLLHALRPLEVDVLHDQVEGGALLGRGEAELLGGEPGPPQADGPGGPDRRLGHLLQRHPMDAAQVDQVLSQHFGQLGMMFHIFPTSHAPILAYSGPAATNRSFRFAFVLVADLRIGAYRGKQCLFGLCSYN